MPSAVLLITCPDQPGIVAGVSGMLFENGANIVHADQHVDRAEGLFLQRIEFESDNLALIQELMSRLAGRLSMRWTMKRTSTVEKVAVLVSRQAHCLSDLLARWDGGDLPGEPVAVVSNHPDHEELVGHHRLPYHYIPVTDDQEQRIMSTIANVDLVVLARYMRILSRDFVDRYPNRIINIHHSFLPAFAGARPYHQAHERGVKIIGATAHYVTAQLDEGPIIEQDVSRVSHRDGVADLVRKGRDLEKIVLARAVRYHLEHRVLTYANKTVVFD